MIAPLLLAVALSCSPAPSAPPEPPAPRPAWTDQVLILAAVVEHTMPTFGHIDPSALFVQDAWLGRARHLSLPSLRLDEPGPLQVFQTGPGTADVLADSSDRDTYEEIRVAFPLTWHPDRTFGDRDPGRFTADRMILHQVGDTLLYTYELRGDYWARVPVEPPPDYGTL